MSTEVFKKGNPRFGHKNKTGVWAQSHCLLGDLQIAGWLLYCTTRMVILPVFTGSFKMGFWTLGVITLQVQPHCWLVPPWLLGDLRIAGWLVCCTTTWWFWLFLEVVASSVGLLNFGCNYLASGFRKNCRINLTSFWFNSEGGVRLGHYFKEKDFAEKSRSEKEKIFLVPWSQARQNSVSQATLLTRFKFCLGEASGYLQVPLDSKKWPLRSKDVHLLCFPKPVGTGVSKATLLASFKFSLVCSLRWPRGGLWRPPGELWTTWNDL